MRIIQDICRHVLVQRHHDGVKIVQRMKQGPLEPCRREIRTEWKIQRLSYDKASIRGSRLPFVAVEPREGLQLIHGRLSTLKIRSRDLQDRQLSHSATSLRYLTEIEDQKSWLARD